MEYQTNTMAEEISPFIVTSTKAGTVVYPPGSIFGPRIQQDLQLVLLHTGTMTVKIDHTSLTLPPGHITLLKPGYEETFYFAKQEETWHRWIAISFAKLPISLGTRLSQLPYFIPISDRMNRIVELMLLLQNASLDCQESLNDLARAALMLYVSEANQFYQNGRVHPIILAVKEHIHLHYAEHLNLSSMAKHANVTPEHLIRLFRRQEGFTPTKYLWNYRLNQGLELLRNTGLSIGEIAEKTGFKTSYHFSRSMKLLSGKTASEIRIESWNGINPSVGK
jgi:AraC family transcriptional regulator of arabinose operon